MTLLPIVPPNCLKKCMILTKPTRCTYSGDPMITELVEHNIQHPTERKYETPLLLLHGAWHGAWCWAEWPSYFAQLGYEVHTIGLPDHGGTAGTKRHINLYSLGDYVAFLGQEINKMKVTPIVVGHSMGGAVLQKYIQHNALPGAVLLATLPATGIFKMLLRLLRKHPSAILQGLLTMNMYQWVATPALAQALFLNKNSEIDVVEFQQKLVRESLLMGTQTMIPFARMNKNTAVPVLVIAGEKDNVFTIAEEKATAQKYDADFILIKDQAHNLMMENEWQSVADQIHNWIQTTIH